jgi:hypothetical protein
MQPTVAERAWDPSFLHLLLDAAQVVGDPCWHPLI